METAMEVLIGNVDCCHVEMMGSLHCMRCRDECSRSDWNIWYLNSDKVWVMMDDSHVIGVLVD